MAALSSLVRSIFPSHAPGLPVHASDPPGADGAARPRAPTSASFSGRKLVCAYWFDWALVAFLWAVLFVLNRTPGHKREFSLTDISIQHTFATHERVPPLLLGLISAGVPLLVLVAVAAAVVRNPWDVHNAVLGLGMSYTMTGVVTQIVKMMVGRPRPDLIDRCQPAPGSTDAAVYGLSTYAICTTSDLLRLDDGFKSFPSGHSSLSFAGLGFLALYLAGKMHLWDRHGHRTRAWLALSPLLAAAMVAISRTQDNRHHWQDVLVGSTLGLAIAFVAYRTYYPPLKHRACHLPLLPKNAGGDADDDQDDDYDDDGLILPQRVRLLSEEDGVPRRSEEEQAWRSGGA
ncbi:hypothetical protein Q5752_001980 [Cryptotrichosporon argae]